MKHTLDKLKSDLFNIMKKGGADEEAIASIKEIISYKDIIEYVSQIIDCNIHERKCSLEIDTLNSLRVLSVRAFMECFPTNIRHTINEDIGGIIMVSSIDKNVYSVTPKGVARVR